MALVSEATHRKYRRIRFCPCMESEGAIHSHPLFPLLINSSLTKLNKIKSRLPAAKLHSRLICNPRTRNCPRNLRGLSLDFTLQSVILPNNLFTANQELGEGWWWHDFTIPLTCCVFRANLWPYRKLLWGNICACPMPMHKACCQLQAAFYAFFEIYWFNCFRTAYRNWKGYTCRPWGVMWIKSSLMGCRLTYPIATWKGVNSIKENKNHCMTRSFC
jgi:hypothetical protein